MSRLPTIVSTTLALVLSHSIPATVATKDDAPTTSITTVWCPEDYGGFPGAYKTYASVIAADATATTYKLDCLAPWDDVDSLRGCSAWPSVTFTVGPSTAVIYASNGGEYHGTRGMACELGPSTAQCDFILQGRGPEAMAQTGRWPQDPINGTEYEAGMQTLTITAGLEKLSGGGGGAVTVPVTTIAGADGAQATAGVSAGTGSSPGLKGPQETGSGAASGTLSAATGAPTSGAGSLVSRAIAGVGMGLVVLCSVCLL